jgi:uncharacterized membrane protein
METSAPDMRRQLDRWMRRLSLGVSLVAVAAMLLGLGDILFTGSLETLSGTPAIPVASLLHPGATSFGLFATSLGIVLLSLLPGLRVLLAAGLYARRRELKDAAVALLVFIELTISLLTGRG